jgi:hypothetical protein
VIVEMAAAMTVTAVILELLLVARYRFLLDLFARNSLIGICFSMLLSWILGTMFEATGMVVFFSAVSSTIVTALFYRFGAGALLSVESLLATLGMAA